MKSLRTISKVPRGFTLIEIFVVIAILAVLASMGWQATKMVRTRQMNKTAEIQIGQLELGMNAYRQDYGDVLPAGNGDDKSANVLYTALYCDYNNDGEPDEDEKTGEIMTPYCDAIVPETTSSKRAKETLNGIQARKMRIKSAGSGHKEVKRYVIIDPWGKPYLYRLGYEMKDEKGREGKGINPDFDIFSMGPDGSGNGLTNKGDNEDNISNVRSWE